jgi:hypothetical protein
MEEIVNEERLQIRRTLKWSLRSDPWRLARSHDLKPNGYDKKLDGWLAYGLVKKRLPQRTVRVLRMHFEQGLPLEKIAAELKLSTRQIIRYLNKGLDVIFDNAPAGIKVSLSPGSYTWLLQGCRRCGGDLYWDSEGAHGRDGEYCCLLCGERFTVGEMEQK